MPMGFKVWTFCLAVTSGLTTDLLSPLFFSSHILHSLTLFTSLFISSLVSWWFHFQASYRKVWTFSLPSPHLSPLVNFPSVLHEIAILTIQSKTSGAVFLLPVWFRSFIAWKCRKYFPHLPEAKVKF